MTAQEFTPSSASGSRAVVLGGGGVPGLAWMIGYLHGAITAGVPLAGADLVVGTSAGSVAATLLRTPGGLSAAFGRLSGAGELPFEAAPPGDGFADAVPRILADTTSPDTYARAFLELGATVPPTPQVTRARRRTMRERTGTTRWPDGALLVTALSRTTGGRRVLTRDSGVDLLTALSASCAVPGAWPVVPLPDGDVCIDAGVLSATHADLAQGAERVVILRPVPNLQGDLATEANALGHALVIEPEHPLPGTGLGHDPRPAAALAGFTQAHAQTDLLRSAWGAASTTR